MKYLFLLFIVYVFHNANAQSEYEVSEGHPYGQVNPDAPKQLSDYKSLIGLCNCQSTRRSADGSWGVPEKTQWKFKYIMNGMAIQDESLKKSGSSGSIRQYNVDSLKWYVHYYSVGSSQAMRTWEGNKKEDGIILYRDLKSPNGMEGNFKITFYDISIDGFRWKGEWVNKDESIIYPTWKIDCKKQL